jgi:hypothetical protein
VMAKTRARNPWSARTGRGMIGAHPGESPPLHGGRLHQPGGRPPQPTRRPLRRAPARRAVGVSLTAGRRSRCRQRRPRRHRLPAHGDLDRDRPGCRRSRLRPAGPARRNAGRARRCPRRVARHGRRSAHRRRRDRAAGRAGAAPTLLGPGGRRAVRPGPGGRQGPQPHKGKPASKRRVKDLSHLVFEPPGPARPPRRPDPAPARPLSRLCSVVCPWGQWHCPLSSGRHGLEKVLSDSRKTTRSVCSRGVRFRGLAGCPSFACRRTGSRAA